MAWSRCGCLHPPPETPTRCGYIDQGQLDGGWLPGIPLVTAEQAIGDWLGGWAGRPSRDGPLFVVTIPADRRFIGIVGLGDHGQGVIEMSYGIAPCWRGRGLATRAARTATRWALSLLGVRTIEMRIGQHHTASQHVATKAGFVPAGTLTQYVPGTGEMFEDLRYIRQRSPGS
jgi:RimJ/RimL family protein N-acetyltransferase